MTWRRAKVTGALTRSRPDNDTAAPRAAASASYRYFDDTWGVRAHTAELGYTQPISNLWILEGRLRYYTQHRATFYSDLFPFAAASM